MSYSGFLALLFLALFFEGAISWPNGAPCDVLISMTPPPGDPNSRQAPYSIEFLNGESESEPQCYRPHKNYWIRIRSTDGSSFRGFILQCRDTNDNRFGLFLSGSGNANQWQYHCRRSDSITHVRFNRKDEINVLWRPGAVAGEFTCKATVLQSLYVWWAKIPSRVLRPCEDDGFLGNPGGPLLEDGSNLRFFQQPQQAQQQQVFQQPQPQPQPQVFQQQQFFQQRAQP